jgi:hypothetical protein
MTATGRTCGASKKQQYDVYEENRKETKYTSEEMKKHMLAIGTRVLECCEK